MKKAIIILLFGLVFSVLCYGETDVSGDVSGIWEASGSPYFITDHVHIPKDSSLEIMPGCSIYIERFKNIKVDTCARLISKGTIGDSIYFIRMSDSCYNGIMMFSASICSLSFCRVEKSRIFCNGARLLSINNCNLKGGRLTHWDSLGGGIYLNMSEAYIMNSILYNYRITGFNPPVPAFPGNSYGGCIYSLLSNLTISNSYIYGNGAYGGIYSIWSEDHHVFGYAAGGAIFAKKSNLSIINCTICNNLVARPLNRPEISCGNDGGGIYLDDSVKAVIFNTILWGNSCCRYGADIFVKDVGEVCIYYSNAIQLQQYCRGFIIWGGIIVQEDPILNEFDYELTDGSPCVDAGAEFMITPWGDTIYAPTYDFAGNPRPQGTRWDIGADESPFSIVHETKIYGSKKFDVDICPNPMNSTCKIKVPIGATISIVNIRGKIISTQESVNIAAQELSNTQNHVVYTWRPEADISTGLYLAVIISGDHKTVRKFVYLK